MSYMWALCAGGGGLGGLGETCKVFEPRHKKTCFTHMRTTKVQISLRIRKIQIFKTLAGLYSWAGRFKPYLVGNPKDRFSRDEAQL